jgi:Domain of unknown function (DUF1772)
MHLFDLLTIVCVVSMVGTEFTISAFIDPALAELDSETWSRAVPVLARRMGQVMPFWYFLGFLAIGAEAYFRRNESARLWIDVALLLWAIAIVYSITVLVPINNRIAKISAHAVSSEIEDHRRWDSLHRWRVVLLVVAAICLLSGILIV